MQHRRNNIQQNASIILIYKTTRILHFCLYNPFIQIIIFLYNGLNYSKFHLPKKKKKKSII